MVLGQDCSSALRCFLEKSAENMKQSAADEASLRTYFINGLVNGPELTGACRGFMEDAPAAGNQTPGAQDAIADTEKDASPSGPPAYVNAAQVGFVDDTSASSSFPPPVGNAGDSPGGTSGSIEALDPQAPRLVDDAMTSPNPFDVVDHREPEVSVLGTGAAVVQDKGQVSGVDPNILAAGSSGPPPGVSSNVNLITDPLPPPLVTVADGQLARSPDGEDSELTSLTDEDEDVATTDNHAGGPTVLGKGTPEVDGRPVQEPGRHRKPAVIYTSGAVLTPRLPPTKRARVTGTDPRRSEPPAKIKIEDRYWETTQAYWNKAVRLPSTLASLGDSRSL